MATGYHATAANSAMASDKTFWSLTIPEISSWVRKLTPGVPNTGGMLFPKKLDAKSTTDKSLVQEYNTKLTVGNKLLNNLVMALSCASSYTNGNTTGVNGQPNPKRPKLENGGNGNKGDVFNVLDPSFAKSSGTTSSELSPGAVLSRMTLGGLVNGLAGVPGGVVDTLTCIPLSELANGNNNGEKDEATKKEERKKLMEEVVATAGDLPLKQVIQLARGLHRSVAAR